MSLSWIGTIVSDLQVPLMPIRYLKRNFRTCGTIATAYARKANLFYQSFHSEIHSVSLLTSKGSRTSLTPSPINEATSNWVSRVFELLFVLTDFDQPSRPVLVPEDRNLVSDSTRLSNIM